GRCSSIETMRAPPWPVTALLLALAARGAAASVPTYPWRDAETGEWLVCDQCPPGTFVQRPCGRDSPTTCGACPPRHYTQFWNYLERCRYWSGFFEHAGFCLEHASCPPGAGVAAPGGSSSSSERCQPHRNCTALGLAVNVPGSPFHDALCTNCTSFQLGLLEPGARGEQGVGWGCLGLISWFLSPQTLRHGSRLGLHERAETPSTVRPPPPLREGRAALQRRLWQQLMELREARPGALGVRLLQALRAARLPGLERSIREHFLPA
ncbi:hypothetical protein K5549_017782, partial [Capra hircus]